MTLPKIVFTDIDGVWTDSGMYYTESGDELKRFTTYDSAGVLILRHLNIPLVVISGENHKATLKRAKKLKVDHVYVGIENKVELANKIVSSYAKSLKEAAYIGDDMNDYELLGLCGISACPNNAHELIKTIAKWQLKKNGGEGVFREFVEKIIINAGLSLPDIYNEIYYKKD
jgi:3-deoxy-D-manno-octulosonate 8-phosphate phosphatase (KDO 8-P phosphatase)